MPAILSTNMASLYAQRSLSAAQTDLANSVQKLSSGKRINAARDDVAGLGISEGVAGIRNISDQSIRNLQNASSLVQTADGALDVVGKILQRVSSLITQKNDLVLNATQRASIDTEITSLTDEIARVKSRTTFNGSSSVFGQTYSFGAGAGVTTSITIPDLTVSSLGLQSAVQTISASLVADSTSDTFNIAAHGFSSGDAVVYRNGSGDPVGGLTSGTTYYVIKISNDSFKLASSSANATAGTPVPIDITSLGTVADDSLQKKFSINAVGVDNSSTNVLVLSRPTWGVDAYLVFNRGAALAGNVSPLIDGTVYQIASNNGVSITLKDLSGNAINFAAGQNLYQSSLGYLDRSITGSSAAISESTDTFNITAHGFSAGQQIFYKSTNLSVGNLPNGTYYVIKTDNDNFKLAATSADALAGTPTAINLGAITGSGTFDLKYAVTTASSFNINPILQSNILQVNDATGLSNNDVVIYHQASGGTIGGLTDGNPYFVVTGGPGNSNTFSLSTTLNNGSPVTISAGTGTGFNGASFEKVTGASFNSTSSSVVTVDASLLRSASSNGYSTGDALVYSVTGGDKLSGLTNGSTYYAIAVNGTDFRLASSSANALAGTAIGLGTNGSGTDQFTNSSSITTATVADAIRTNASNRAGLGAQLNALNYAIDNLQTLSNNLNDAYSRISDVDYASETSSLTKNQIMQEAATAMLAQANQMPNVILTLLK
jgi:flagellin